MRCVCGWSGCLGGCCMCNCFAGYLIRRNFSLPFSLTFLVVCWKYATVKFPVAAEAAHFSTDSNDSRSGRSHRAVKWLAPNICRWRLVAKGAPSKAHTYCQTCMALAETIASSSKCQSTLEEFPLNQHETAETFSEVKSCAINLIVMRNQSDRRHAQSIWSSCAINLVVMRNQFDRHAQEKNSLCISLPSFRPIGLIPTLTLFYL